MRHPIKLGDVLAYKYPSRKWVVMKLAGDYVIHQWDEDDPHPTQEQIDAWNEILKDPSQECIPPATFNTVTGMCESSSPATEVGTITYTYSDAIPNGIPAAVAPSNEWMYGKDCPIFAGNPNNSLNGAGNNAQLIGNINSWWTTYDASPTGPVAQQIPGVTEISFVNALAKAPPSGWPSNTELSYVIPVNNTTATNVVIHVFIASRSAFGLKLNASTILVF